MIKLVILCLYLCMYGGVRGIPIKTADVVDDLNKLDNEADVIEAGEWLPGINNLSEKRLPVIRLVLPDSYIGLYGSKNLDERVQVPQNYNPLPGSRNLDEKAISEEIISKLFTSRHPKSEVENIKVIV